MSNDVEVFNPQAPGLPAELASIFDVSAQAGDLTSGAGGGFQAISYRGSRWRIKAGGDEHTLLNEAGETVPSLEVVMLKAKPEVSKIYYATKYSEGDDAAPTCFSIDGVKPDSASEVKQSPSCATCAHNEWGSRITEAGKKAKECSDSRRVAVWVKTPCPDGVDDSEPMLLRIPPASLGDLKLYGNNMAQKGYPYNALVTRIGFDLNVSYPKLTFKAERPISNAEAHEIVRMTKTDTISNILHTSQDISNATPQIPEEPAVEEAPNDKVTEINAAKKATPKKTATKSKAPKKAAPKEDKSKVQDSVKTDELDNIIAEMEQGNLGL